LGRLQVARAQLHAADPVIAGLIDRRPDYDPRHRLDGIPPDAARLAIPVPERPPGLCRVDQAR
jgi:hypothetical protein